MIGTTRLTLFLLGIPCSQENNTQKIGINFVWTKYDQWEWMGTQLLTYLSWPRRLFKQHNTRQWVCRTFIYLPNPIQHEKLHTVCCIKRSEIVVNNSPSFHKGDWVRDKLCDFIHYNVQHVVPIVGYIILKLWLDIKVWYILHLWKLILPFIALSHLHSSCLWMVHQWLILPHKTSLTD
jgi:hypothetical protein